MAPAPVTSEPPPAPTEPVEVAPLEPWGAPDDTTESIEQAPADLTPMVEPEPIELTPGPGAEPAGLMPEFGAASAGVPEGLPDFLETSGPASIGDEASDLERFVQDAGDSIEFIEVEPAGSAPAEELGGAAMDEEGRPRAPFFPEEEFGRALTDVDEIDYLDAEVDTAVIETASGQRIRLEVDVDAAAEAAVGEERPGLLRSIGAALVAALAGAAVWGVLSVPAGHGASPLAVAVGFMVGISVRLKGAGHTLPFRIVGVFFTLFGSLIGAVLAASALAAMAAGQGITGVIGTLSDPGTLPAMLQQTFGPLDLLSIALALYIAFRLSASKPSS